MSGRQSWNSRSTLRCKFFEFPSLVFCAEESLYKPIRFGHVHSFQRTISPSDFEKHIVGKIDKSLKDLRRMLLAVEVGAAKSPQAIFL